MFTGIITDVGEVIGLEQQGDLRVRVKTSYETNGIDLGASVCCSGVCLTVVEKKAGLLGFDVSGETLSRTNLGGWAEGSKINMERSLRVGDELGGHIITGHIDGVGEIISIVEDGGSKVFKFSYPDGLAKFIAEKGSVAINGTSLTVNGVADDGFDVNLVPHTQEMTIFGHASVGDKVNVEIDVLARYLDRMQQVR